MSWEIILEACRGRCAASRLAWCAADPGSIALGRWTPDQRSSVARCIASGERRGHLSLLLDEDTVLIGRAEIDVDTPDAVAFESEELGIAETLAVLGDAAVGHEGG